MEVCFECCTRSFVCNRYGLKSKDIRANWKVNLLPVRQDKNTMKIVVLSNFFNHHQKPLADALDNATKHQFRFVSTASMSEEREKMGWSASDASYVIDASRDTAQKQLALQWVEEADLVIWGDAPLTYVYKRLAKGKLTVRSTERIFKEGFSTKEFLPRAVKHFLLNWPCRNQYLFCMSAYAAQDYAKIGLYKGHAYKWGYFTETKHYDLEKLFEQKANNREKVILWTGRFISWKHPEAAIFVAERLKQQGIPFQLDIIGDGELRQVLEKNIREKKLEKCVRLLGAMPPQEVRKHMENANIFLFTSDQNEGWGAVLNESMNSGCAVVANQSIGSVPYLMQNGKNGLIYQNDDWQQLYQSVQLLLNDKDLVERLGRSAYQTITTEWNAENAARILMHWSETRIYRKDKMARKTTGKSGILQLES